MIAGHPGIGPSGCGRRRLQHGRVLPVGGARVLNLYDQAACPGVTMGTDNLSVKVKVKQLFVPFKGKFGTEMMCREIGIVIINLSTLYR